MIFHHHEKLFSGNAVEQNVERFPRMVHELTAGGKHSIPHYDIGPRARVPRLALIADLDDQALNGLFVLSRLAAFLQDIESGHQQTLRLRERVLIIPASGSALSAQTLDTKPIMKAIRPRSEAIAALTRQAYYRVDIHPAGLDLEEMPQVRLYRPNDDERASACLFGLPAVIERPLEVGDAPSLVRTWRRCGGENFVIYAGQAGGLQTKHCETLFRAFIAFLDRTGIVSGLRPMSAEEDLRYFGLRQVIAVQAEQSGVFSSHQEVGRWVRVGEPLGFIYDNFTGEERAQVLAPATGLLSSLYRQPLLQAGDLVARILTPENPLQRRRVRRAGERHERRFAQRY